MKRFITILTIIAIGLSLLNSPHFGSPTMAAYFLYTIIAALIICIANVRALNNRTFSTSINKLPLILFFCLVLYYTIQGLLNPREGMNMSHIFLICNFMLLISYCFLLEKKEMDILLLCKGILLLAVIESFVCLLQYASLVNSFNSFFKVTGTWVNPNVTAMFLTMAMPAAAVVLFHAKKRMQMAIAVCMFLIILSVILLQCRTALIGIFVEAVIFVQLKYNATSVLLRKFSRLQLLLFSIAILSGTTFSLFGLYKMKQGSADGRNFIWKISIEMVRQKPLGGYGYGMFERDFNLAQADYFNKQRGTESEIANAAYVHMAYSEFAENAIEGGIIALILLTALFIGLLFYPPRRNTQETPETESIICIAAYAGISAFTVMSLLNFTIQAVPVMALFILYSAVRLNDPTYKPFFEMKMLQDNFSKTAAVVFLGAGIAICISQISLAGKYIDERNEYASAKQTNVKNKQVYFFESNEEKLKDYDLYWLHYASILYNMHQYEKAIDKIQVALKHSSDPDLYHMLGNCCKKLNRYNEAAIAYSLEKSMQPNRFAPRYALMKLYIKAGDRTKAVEVANEIITMPVKINSEKVTYYKKQAMLVSQQFDTEKFNGLFDD